MTVFRHILMGIRTFFSLLWKLITNIIGYILILCVVIFGICFVLPFIIVMQIIEPFYALGYFIVTKRHHFKEKPCITKRAIQILEQGIDMYHSIH